MMDDILTRQANVRRWIAAGGLALLGGCATVAPAPEPQQQQSVQSELPPSPLSLLPEPVITAPVPPVPPAESAQLAEPVAPPDPAPSPKPVAVPLRSRIADFIARRLPKKADRSAVAAAPVAEAPAPPEAPVDEKYRLTGQAARELERGHASWYGAQFHGRRTASGENYDKYALTAAHKTLPFGTIVRVRSLTLGREVDVRINDRGPYARGRVIDVSQAAAEALGLTASGVAEVSLNIADTLDDVIVFPQPAKKIRRKPH